MEEQPKWEPLKLLRPGVKEKILAALSKGATYHLACGYAGVSYTQFREWTSRGEKIKDLHPDVIETHKEKHFYDFYQEVKRVEAYAAIKWLEKIDRAAEVQWQAAAWKLERRHPKDYGRIEQAVSDEKQDSSISKAKDEVNKLKSDDHGRSTTTES